MLVGSPEGKRPLGNLRHRWEDNNVAYLLKVRTLAPDKQLLLEHGSETTFLSRQRLRKHVPAATNVHATE
jgi:hypothetical protein